MGYYSEYTLEVTEPRINHAEKLCATTGACFDEAVKWYDHEKDMREYSKKFPENLFILEGRGENSDDLWIKYFKNGKMQAGKKEVVFEKFNASKLT